MKIPARVLASARASAQAVPGALVGIGVATPDTWVEVNYMTEQTPRGITMVAYCVWANGVVSMATNMQDLNEIINFERRVPASSRAGHAA